MRDFNSFKSVHVRFLVQNNDYICEYFIRTENQCVFLCWMLDVCVNFVIMVPRFVELYCIANEILSAFSDYF